MMQAYTAAAQKALEVASQEAGGDEDEATGSPDDHVHICISLLYACVNISLLYVCVYMCMCFGRYL